MSGSGSRDFGSPPWDPAEPVPDLNESTAMPSLGAAPGPGGTSVFGGTAWSTSTKAESDGTGQAGAFDVPKTAIRPGPSEHKASWERDRQPKRKSGRRRSFWRELPVLIVIALVLALVIKTYAIQAFFIPSASMENTLEIGDRVLINKVVYHLRPIHRGDIVVFDGTGSWDFNQPPSNSNVFSKAVDELEGIVGISHDSSIYIKRVVGLPGDRVACCNVAGQVTVNGAALSESPYLYPGNSPSLSRFNVTVPPGRLWVMGDHRAVSYDSRGHMGDPGNGTIAESAVLGRAFVIIWPPTHWGILNIPATFEQPQNIPATFEQPQLNSSAAAAGGSASALAAAMANGTSIREAATPLPLALGFAGALPLTWLQRTARRRLTARRSRRRKPE